MPVGTPVKRGKLSRHAFSTGFTSLGLRVPASRTLVRHGRRIVGLPGHSNPLHAFDAGLSSVLVFSHVESVQRLLC